MEELICGCCGKTLGWISDSAPRGWVYCDFCKPAGNETNTTEE